MIDYNSKYKINYFVMTCNPIANKKLGNTFYFIRISNINILIMKK